MGRDKATLDWHGKPLLQHMIDLLAPTCVRVTIVGRLDLPDDIAGLGPIGGIATALRRSTTDRNIVVAVDLPLLTNEFIKYFAEFYRASTRPLCACRIASRFPLCLGVDRQFIPALDEYIANGGRSVHGLLLAGHSEVLTEERLQTDGFSSKIFANVNTADDYRALNHDSS
jgi:molybdopterin-guanine dinucleotide biosynthesis protein A